MINDTPNSVEELRRAAARIHSAVGIRTDSPSYDPRIQHAFDLMRTGSPDEGHRELQVLAEEGSVQASKILDSLDRYGPDALSLGDHMQRALAGMRGGEIAESFEELVQLADGGYAPAAHFLAWLHRYRAVELLRHSAARFRQAVEGGYPPSERHLARVEEALLIVDFAPGTDRGHPRD